MNNFATINDVKALWRNLTEDERIRAEALLPVIADSLRNEAKKVGKNLDEMIMDNESLANVAKSVTVE